MYSKIQIPRSIYNTEEHQFFRQTIQEYIRKDLEPNREKWEEQGYCDKEAWLKAGELGLLCLTTAEEYGGGGLDFSFSALLIEESTRQGQVSPAVSMHSDIVAPYIEKYGSEYLKSTYLPKMATGEWVGSLGMTEPGTGSDVQAIKTTAVDKGDYYLLNGAKTFITIGYTSEFTIVACKTNPGTDREGISLLVVDANLEGFSKGNPFKKIGLKSSDTCELFFEDVKVPKENLLGQEGKGFIYMMQELPRERLTVAIQAIGAVQGVLEQTLEYTQQRTAFKQPICAFQNTQFKLAEVATQLQIHTCFVDKCVELLAEEKLTAEQGAMAKYATTDMQNKMIDECLQLFGGYGYMWEYPVARQWADARVSRIYAGTNEIMKLMIARALLQDFFGKLKAMRKAKNLKTV